MRNTPSATRIILYLLMASLCVLLFLTYRGEQFKDVFDLFKTSVVAVVAFFFGKSTQESMGIPVQQPQNVSEPEKVNNEIVIEK